MTELNSNLKDKDKLHLECDSCKQLKPLTDYYINKYDDFVSVCKDCIAKQIEQYGFIDICMLFNIPALTNIMLKMKKYHYEHTQNNKWFGRYLSHMKLHDYRNFTFNDTLYLDNIRKNRLAAQQIKEVESINEL